MQKVLKDMALQDTFPIQLLRALNYWDIVFLYSHKGLVSVLPQDIIFCSILIIWYAALFKHLIVGFW
jgi:hypothetical protein